MKPALFACLCLLLIAGHWKTSSLAQSHEPTPRAEGQLKGLVLDPNESRIVGAKVTLENKDFKFEVWSNDEGAFEVRVPAGDYRLRIENNGFKPYVRRKLRIEADKTETIRPTLSPAEPPGLLKVN